MSFVSEIGEHASAMKTLIAEMFDHGGVEQIKQSLDALPRYRKIILSGMGSSLFVSELCALLLRKYGIDAVAAESNELCCNNLELVTQDTLLVAISQSGRSKELLALCQQVKKLCPIIAVTNNLDGELAKEARFVVAVSSGDEHFTASKSYTNSIAAALALTYCILKLPIDSLAEQLRICAEAMAKTLADHKMPKDATKFMGQVENILFMGSGYSYASACQGEIITAEAAKVFASHYTTGQFIHGPVEMIRGGYVYVVFDTNRSTEESVRVVADMVIRFGGKLIHVSNRRMDSDHPNYYHIPVIETLPEVAPILEMLPMVLILNQLGIERGLDPGKLTVVGK